MSWKQRSKNFFEGSAIFWIVRKWSSERIDFPFFSRLYGLRKFGRDQKTDVYVFFGSLPSVVWYIASAGLFILVTQWLGTFLTWDFSTAFTDDHIGLLISTIVTVSGVFLGLYFAALSAVAGGLFMRAPDDLQSIFIRERRGKQYVRIIALTTLIGIFYLFLRTFDYTLSPVGPFILSLLAAYSVVRFLALGTQTFYFIHPTETCAAITGDCSVAINSASVEGYGWRKDYLQNHYRKQAQNALGTLESLVDFGAEALKLSDEQMTVIVRAVAGLLVFYLDKKKRIPSDSFWYRQKVQHKNWILTDAIELTLSLNTGRGLDPNNVKDRIWFEQKCLDIVFKLFDHFISKKQWESAHVCVEVLGVVNEKAGAELYDDVAKTVITRMDKVVQTVLGASYENADDRIGQMALIDSVGRLGISTALGLLRYVSSHSLEELEREILGIDFKSKKTLYRSEFLGRELAHLEIMVERLKTERAIEGKTISPSWYLLTITGQRYLFALKFYLEFIQTFCANYYKKNADLLIDKNRFEEAAILIERWLEFAYKVDLLVGDFKKLFEACAEFKKVTDLPWPDIDFDKLSAFSEDCGKNAVDTLTRLIPHLSPEVGAFNPDLPDHFGHAYTFGVQGCYEAARDNDLPRLKKILPAIFIAALTAYDTTVKQTQGWQQDSQIAFSSEPLEDLLTLSGYIKLYSELYENPELWGACEAIWSGYLSANTEPKNFIGLVANLMKYRDGLFTIMPKAIIRTNWDMAFRRKLEEMHLVADRSDALLSGTVEAIRHPSPIIRVTGTYSMISSTDVRNLFLILYLLKDPAAQGIEFGDRQEIERRIQEAIKEYEEGDE